MGYTEQKVQEGNMQLNDIEQTIAETEEKISLAKEELRSAARTDVKVKNTKAIFAGGTTGGNTGGSTGNAGGEGTAQFMSDAIEAYCK